MELPTKAVLAALLKVQPGLAQIHQAGLAPLFLRSNEASEGGGEGASSAASAPSPAPAMQRRPSMFYRALSVTELPVGKELTEAEKEERIHTRKTDMLIKCLRNLVTEVRCSQIFVDKEGIPTMRKSAKTSLRKIDSV